MERVLGGEAGPRRDVVLLNAGAAIVAAGPLALLGLGWLIFGRTRRKEAEAFTRSVVTMRNEAKSLEALLGVLSQRIEA